MITNNTALQSLAIVPTFVTRRSFPEMMQEFQQSTLPQGILYLAILASELFTWRELSIWGAQGGWNKLER